MECFRKNWHRFLIYGCVAKILLEVVGFSAPGDLQLEILSRTQESVLGPGGHPVIQFEVSPPGDTAPVAIDESGFVSFAAQVEVEGAMEYGIFRALAPGSFETLVQTDQLAPGLDTFDSTEPDNRRDLQLGNSPRRGFAVNREGSTHALNLYSRFDGPFLYSAKNNSISSEPISWPQDISQNRNLWDFISISDGRGTEKIQSAGSSGDMLVSPDGTLFWKIGNAILRATNRHDVHAVVFTGTPASGFEGEENAMIGTTLDLRGVDASNNAYFRCRVSKASGDVTVLYRQNYQDNSLSLLFVGGQTPLPDGTGNEVTVFVDADDLAVLEDGTVFLRGSVSGGATGFWKRLPGGEFELIKWLTEIPETETDQGAVGFRSVAVDFADWAVADDHSVYFTGDVRFGASGINQEGLWKLKPEDGSIVTLARAPLNGSFGDAPGTDATYGSIVQISAVGPGKLAFISELSDGSRGLFATDKNEGVLKIIKEGDALDGSVVQSFHFTSDVAGDELRISKGAPGLNKYGELAFLATLANGTTVLVKASYEGEERAKGIRYIWDGGIDGIDWHEVENGQTNWVDSNGVRWDEPPTSATAEVTIPAGFYVELTESIPSISKLEAAGTFELFADLTVREETVLKGEVYLRNNASLTSEGNVEVNGNVTSWKDGIRTVSTDAEHTVTTKGMIDGIETGIWAAADNGVMIDNEASVSANDQ
ncbi:MAG: hypothetical protein KJT03_17130, partial [Verrucomicrobiae bacterium]|nr:hypothetical protein [Verrucomicrobiae bacterium]